jgi:myosin heavy subunit
MSSALTSMATGGMFGDSKPDFGKMLRKLESQRRKRINEGLQKVDKAFAGFTPAFYDEYANKIQEAALPQLGEQVRDAVAQQSFGLASRNLGGSSMAMQSRSNLARATDSAKRNLVESSITSKQNLQRELAAERSRIVTMLFDSAMPAEAARMAIETASMFETPSVQKPIQSFLPGAMSSLGVGGQ